MKKFTINCDFGGQMAPFAIYIGKPEKKHHPLHFQADWLSKQRGGMIPSEVMDAVGQLQELAEKNGVSLEELCVYALGTDEEKQEENEANEELQDDESELNASAPLDMDDSEPDILDKNQLEEEDIDADEDYEDEFLIPDEDEILEYENYEDEFDEEEDDDDDEFDETDEDKK